MTKFSDLPLEIRLYVFEKRAELLRRENFLKRCRKFNSQFNLCRSYWTFEKINYQGVAFFNMAYRWKHESKMNIAIEMIMYHPNHYHSYTIWEEYRNCGYPIVSTKDFFSHQWSGTYTLLPYT